MQPPPRNRSFFTARRDGLVGGVILVVLIALGKGAWSRGGDETSLAPAIDTTRYVPQGDEGLGVSVVIVLDNSGSMADEAEGDERPKAVVARQAIEQALSATDAAVAKRPDFPVKVGIIAFSDVVESILPVQPYRRESIRTALTRLPAPDGGTAIGDAMDSARVALYGAGTFRKVMLIVTDGENTGGRKPADVAREIAARSDGSVRMYFVAFDTDPAKFGFVRSVKGDVVTAQNSSALQASLSSLYESKVLAEAQAEPEPLTSSQTAPASH
jgi:uncharacterized protein YegL